MLLDTMRGIFPILVTPFDEQYRIDEDSLRNLIDFNLAAGVHGLGIAIGSEMHKLTEAEREQMTRIVVEQVNGRVPVVVNTSAQGTDLAVANSKAAEELGANALMVLPPTFMATGPMEILHYFQAISDAVNIPIFLQDTSTARIPANLARTIAEECKQARYIKVESLPTPETLTAMIGSTGDLLTVFGGAGGNYLMEEFRRGSQGSMPFCSQPEVFVKVWHLFQAGDEAMARREFAEKILPVSRLVEGGTGIFYSVHKEILRRRGVIHTAKVRSPAPALDAFTNRELQQLLDDLYPASR